MSLLDGIRARVSPQAYALYFAAAEAREGGIVALPSEFLREAALRRFGGELRHVAAETGLARVELVVDPTLEAAHQGAFDEDDERAGTPAKPRLPSLDALRRSP